MIRLPDHGPCARCGKTVRAETMLTVTRAILRAFDDRYELLGPLEDNWQEVCLAAAIRTLADYQPEPYTEGPLNHWFPDDRTRRELRIIAQELDPQ